MSKKQIIIKYESDGFLPSEIRESIEHMEKYILDDHLEPDKIVCHISRLQGDIIRFLAKHGEMK